MPTSYGNQTKPVFRGDSFPAGIDADNPHIMKWWTSAHDAAISDAIRQYQWHWYEHIAKKVGEITSPDDLEEWKASDPLCQRYVWYNALMYFACARAAKNDQLRIIRDGIEKKCLLCGQRFRDDSVPGPLAERIGIDQIEFCSPCLTQAIFSDGAIDASEDDITAYLKELTTILERVPHAQFGRKVGDLYGMPTWQQFAVLQLMQRKPHPERVKKLFGSWRNALARATLSE